MGLRLVAQEYSMSIAVSPLAKYKTALQMLLLSWLILNPYQLFYAPWWNGIETMLLFITVLVALVSAGQYVRFFNARIKSEF